MGSDPFKSKKQTEKSVQHFKNCFNDDQQGYVVVICYSISVEIVLIVSGICWEKQIYFSQVSL